MATRPFQPLSPVAPERIYVGARTDIIREVGGLSHIYAGKYLVCPDGPSNWDCEGADNKAELRFIVAEYRQNYPKIEVCFV